MFRSILIAAALVVTTACSTLDPLKESPFGGGETVGSDTGAEDTGSGSDSGDGEMNFGSVTEDDSNHGLNTAPTPNCTFLVNTWDGEVEMGNTLSITPNESTPSGTTVPGRTDGLWVDFTADDPDCADLLITGFMVKLEWTDNAGYVDEDGIPRYGWTPTWVGGSVDGETMTGVAPTIPTGHTAFAYIGFPFVVPAGETVTVMINGDLDGASAELDDTALFTIIGTSVGVYDGASEPRMLMEEDVIGGTLLF